MPIKFTDLQQAVLPVSGQNVLPDIRAMLSGSAEVIKIVAGLGSQPGYFIPKGDITSGDLATQALGVKRARVMG